jgi:hypothetical protein
MTHLSGFEPQTVTITYSRPGLQGPVYIVSNMTFPRWQLRQMLPCTERAEAGEEMFYSNYDNVAAGTYQYKIRVGQDEWVVDASREISKLTHDPYLNLPS